MVRRKSVSKKLILTSKTGDGPLVVYLVGLSLGLWWPLRRTINGLAAGVEPEAAEAHEASKASEPVLVSTRRVAGWAFACALDIMPIGAALGGAWPQIAAVMFAGR